EGWRRRSDLSRSRGDSWITSWLPSWCPTSPSQLKDAEEKMLKCECHLSSHWLVFM
uniref:Abhydrolase domain containing 5, lysophosphatidic acid acyltransferase n=1 Tax=Sphaeramia orbicularis TaxID=375764 RepID=A0A672Z5B5_9TELE